MSELGFNFPPTKSYRDGSSRFYSLIRKTGRPILWQGQRTTCSKAQKWPPTKLTHIVINLAVLFPLLKLVTDIRFGDKLGSKVMSLKPFSYQENYIVVVYVCNLLLYFFLFEWVLIIHMAYKVSQKYINLVSLSIWPFASLFVRSSVRLFLNF